MQKRIWTFCVDSIRVASVPLSLRVFANDRVPLIVAASRRTVEGSEDDSAGDRGMPEEVEVLVLGNSIGGFTAALLAAALHETPVTIPLSPSRQDTVAIKVRCGGLVLCNTAGVTLRDNAAEQSAPGQRAEPSTLQPSSSSSSSLSLRERARFPAYNPPAWLPPETFELVGEGIIRLLQPRVPALLQWLYPSVEQTSVSSSDASNKKR